MALKTNSKAVKAAVREYLKEAVSEMMEEREIITEKPFHEYLAIIEAEKFYQTYNTDYDMFVDWLQGLGGFGADIFYHGSKRHFVGGKVQDLLQDWLQQSDDEVRRYSGSESEKLACYLLWREFCFMLDHE